MSEEKSRKSVFGRLAGRIKRLVFFILKAVYVIPFFALFLLLLGLVYLPDLELDTPLSLSRYEPEPEEFQIIRPKKEGIPRDHFHLIDKWVEMREPNPPICVVCHGTYAHGKEKKVRAMLNLHSGFMACSVCHVRKKGAEDEEADETPDKFDEFLWVDRETGEMKKDVEGEYGKYPAKIYPVKHTEQGPRRVFTPIRAEAAQRFLEIRPDLTPDQVSEAKARLHKGISEEAITCKDCHKKDGYFDFEELGFPERRIKHLVSHEFVDMIDKYEEFHLPEVLDFRGE
jgi:hypothetical protein